MEIALRSQGVALGSIMLPLRGGNKEGIQPMCLAIPAEVMEINDEMATVRVGAMLRKASLMLLPDAQVGDYVIVHAGFALHKVDPGEARESLRLLHELARVGEQDDTP
jgi:hydrogenase expression/formation protein HypC